MRRTKRRGAVCAALLFLTACDVQPLTDEQIHAKIKACEDRGLQARERLFRGDGEIIDVVCVIRPKEVIW